jgi:PKHD-type hydroxylase|tara:strand:+ start:587 stop:1174 length:588 start_codon:yes stop_codon:yes gene_type:complete
MNLKYSYWVFDKYLSKKDCTKIRKLGTNLQKAKVDGYEYSSIRNSEVCFLSDPFIYKLLHPCLNTANKSAGWNFEVDYSESCQFTSYKKNQTYDWHTDTIPGQFKQDDNKNFKNKIRKLSMSVNLSDSKDFKGGDLEFYVPNPRKSFKECVIKSPEMRNQGSVIVFPSFLFHRVKPVTQGRRFSLVMWTLGKDFK